MSLCPKKVYDPTKKNDRVIVVLYAYWDKRSDKIKSLFEEIKEEYANHDIRLELLEATENEEMCHYFNTTSFPSVFVVDNGNCIDSSTGYLTPSQIKNKFDIFLK